MISNVWTKVKRYFFRTLDKIHYWQSEHDICEVCREGSVYTTCEGCEKRICCECETYFYADATICTECEAAITPKEKEQMRKEALAYEAEG